MNPYITCQKSFNEFISIVGTIDNMYNFKFNFEPFVSIETKIIPIDIKRRIGKIYAKFVNFCKVII